MVIKNLFFLTCIVFTGIFWRCNPVTLAPELILDAQHHISQNIAIQAADRIKYWRDYPKAAELFQEILSQPALLTPQEKTYCQNQLTYCWLYCNQDSAAIISHSTTDTLHASAAEQADYWFNAALLKYRRFDRDTLAIVWFKKALESFCQVYPEGHWKTASAMNWIGLCYYELLGDTQLPKIYITSAYKFIKKLPEVFHKEAELGMAIQLRARWGYEESIQHAQKAIQICHKTPFFDTVVVARALANEARIRRINGEYLPADSLLRIAKTLLISSSSNRFQEILKDQLTVYATIPGNNQANFDSTLALFKQTIDRWGSLYGHPDAILGDYFYEKGAFKYAKIHFLAFHRDRSDQPIGAYRDVSLALRSLAELYAHAGKMDSAFMYWRADFLTHYPFKKEAWPLDSLVKPEIYLHTKNPFKSFSMWGKLLTNQYFLNKTQKKTLIQAVQMFELADQTFFQSASDNSDDGLLSLTQEAARDLYPNALRCVYALWKHSKDKQRFINLAIRFGERQKSYILQRNRRNANPAAETSTFAELLETVRELNSRIQARKVKDPLGLSVLQLQLQVDSLHYILREQFPEYTHFVTPEMPNVESVIQQLLPNECLISFSQGKQFWHTLVISRQQIEFIETDLQTLDLNQLCRQWYQMLSNRPDETNAFDQMSFAQTGHLLYQALLGNLKLQTQNITRLTIIPDGILHLIPFESLLVRPCDNTTGAPDFYLNAPFFICQDQSPVIRYAPALRLLRAHQAPTNNKQFKAALFTYGTSEHPNSLIYAHEIKHEFTASFPESGAIFEGAQCNADRFLKEMNRHAIVHLLLHAESNNVDKNAQVIFFGLNAGGKADSLFSYQIAAESCNAALLVLSACQTGNGKQTQDGVYSMARAFMQAGVQQLVYSLWEVDEATHALQMKDFYKHWREHQTAEAALWQAKRAYLAQNRRRCHPYYWAVMAAAG